MPHSFLSSLSLFARELAGQFAGLSNIGSSAEFASDVVVASRLLLAAIWEGALLAAAAALALRLVPRIPAAARFAIWFAVFAVIAALPFLGVQPHIAAQAFAGATGPALLHFDSRWTLAIAAVWVVASLVRAITLAVAALRVYSLSRSAVPIPLSENVAAAAPRHAPICSSTAIDRPTVIGFFSPKILIPAWLLEKLTPAELEQVILHEGGHLHRADDWLNLLQKFALVLFPLNPALVWVERRLCFERELACDEHVVGLLAARSGESVRAATGYASCLATLAEYRLEHRGAICTAAHSLALALGALGTSARESELGRRVTRILRPDARMKPLHVRLATAGAMFSLLFATTELERCPQVVSFAPVSFASASSAAPTNTAQVEKLTPLLPRTTLLPGYRAVAARITIPSAPRMKPVSDALPHLNAGPSRSNAGQAVEPMQRLVAKPTPHATDVRAERSGQPSSARLIATRQTEPQDRFIITRWSVTTWQSGDGDRIVRASEVVSDMPPASDHQNVPEGSTRSAPTPRAQQISQSISPYAAVPVPGGWLVFRL